MTPSNTLEWYTYLYNVAISSSFHFLSLSVSFYLFLSLSHIFTTAFNVVCRWLYQKWRERLDCNYTALFLKLVSCTRVHVPPFPESYFWTRFTRGSLRKYMPAKLFFKMFALMLLLSGACKVFTNIGYASPLSLKRKSFF